MVLSIPMTILVIYLTGVVVIAAWLRINAWVGLHEVLAESNFPNTPAVRYVFLTIASLCWPLTPIMKSRRKP